MNDATERRGFLRRLLALGAVPAAAQAQAPASSPAALPAYARAHDYRSLKQSSFDPTGGNHDFWAIPAGGVREVFNADGPGVITHIWFTIAARSTYHLKEIVLRGYWDGNAKPSVEAPIGISSASTSGSTRFTNRRTWRARRASR